MENEKINNVAIRLVCVGICIFLVIGGIGACINHSYLKGAVGIAATPIIAFIGFKPASIKTWGLMVLVFCVTMVVVGYIGN